MICPHTQKKVGKDEEKKKVLLNQILMLLLNEFGKYVLNIFLPCKTFDYIVSPSTVNILKLLLLGEEMQMMVDCSFLFAVSYLFI